MSKDRKEVVKEYYGETLATSEDLKTTACCPIDSVLDPIKPLLANIHDEIIQRFYGCGSPIPVGLEGLTVVDLGCGTGKDVYTAAQLVGEEGKVIGVDMTEQQLDVANKYIDYHTEKFGFIQSNVEFKKSIIEDLSFLADNSVDVVISNCVINLSDDKERVFREIYRVLKPGGELFFSDVYADKRLPVTAQKDDVIVGECLGGALYTEDFRRILSDVGFNDFRITKKGNVDLKDKEIIDKIGYINFFSFTVRTFKCDLEDRHEDYGHIATYLGNISGLANEFSLDEENTFIANKPKPVSGNIAKILSESRFSKYFKVDGSYDKHFGLFNDYKQEQKYYETLNNCDASSGCC